MYLKRLSIVGLFFLSFMPWVYAQELIVDNSLTEVFVEKLSIFTDSSKTLSHAQIIGKYQNGGFTKTKNFGDGIGLGDYNYWLVLDVKNVSSQSIEVVFEIPLARLDSFTVFSLNKSGILIREASCEGIGANINTKPLRSYGHAVKIEVEANDKKKLFFRLNKFPGSLRASLIAFSPKVFESKQRQINANLSFFIGIGLIVFLTSICIGYLKKDKAYYIFSVLTFLKICLNLQIFNYSQVLQSIGFDRVGTSVYLIITLYFQYQFFKLYFDEKISNYILVLVLSILVFDFSMGHLFQGNKFYYLSSYSIVLYLTVLFLKDIFRKSKSLKKYDYPFISVQLLAILTMIILVLKFWINIYDNFFRKHDFDMLYWSSLVELIIYLGYLFAGLMFLNQDYLKKSLALVKSQKAILEIQENERQRIAQDLHDDLGATLALLSKKALKDDFSEENQSLVKKAIRDLRSISRNLLPADFEAFGLIPSVEKYIASLNEQNLVTFTFLSFGDKVKLKHDTELNIYRIITELANNTMKHSGAKTATIQLVYHPTHLFVSIEDDGKGLEISQNNLGIGLKNVISRIEYLQATVLELGNGRRCSYIFEVPYKPHKP